jgi:hypothetical protein
MTLDDFFRGRDESRRIFEALHAAVDAIGPAALRVTKSQVTFRRRPEAVTGRSLGAAPGRTIAFAWAWMPDVYLGPGHAPLVLTLALRRRDPSPRWKQIVEPIPGRFTHHLELYSADAIDEQVRGWLAEAWRAAA